MKSLQRLSLKATFGAMLVLASRVFAGDPPEKLWTFAADSIICASPAVSADGVNLRRNSNGPAECSQSRRFPTLDIQIGWPDLRSIHRQRWKNLRLLGGWRRVNRLRIAHRVGEAAVISFTQGARQNVDGRSP
jgi:hypothetical protein